MRLSIVIIALFLIACASTTPVKLPKQELRARVDTIYVLKDPSIVLGWKAEVARLKKPLDSVQHLIDSADNVFFKETHPWW
jgi:hypothetical protein